jgi:hypothetical protein
MAAMMLEISLEFQIRDRAASVRWRAGREPVTMSHISFNV